jgi:hypothetical protein
MSLDDWDPEKEKENDPVKLQQEQLALARRYMAKIEKAEQEAAARKAEAEAAAGQVAHVVGAFEPPKPPSFEVMSAALKKSWDETKLIVPDAPDSVKSFTFQTLAQTRFYELRGPTCGPILSGPP